MCVGCDSGVCFFVLFFYERAAMARYTFIFGVRDFKNRRYDKQGVTVLHRPCPTTLAIGPAALHTSMLQTLLRYEIFYCAVTAPLSL